MVINNAKKQAILIVFLDQFTLCKKLHCNVFTASVNMYKFMKMFQLSDWLSLNEL